MGEEVEHLRVPLLKVLHDRPGDAEGAGKPAVQEVEEDLRCRPKGTVDDVSQVFLYIRTKVPVFRVSRSLYRIWPKSGIEVTGIVDIESQTDLW